MLCKIRKVKGKGFLLAQTLLSMKLMTLLLFVSVLQVSAKGLSQQFSFTGKKMPLEKVFAIIEQQSNYSFIYKYNDLQQAKPVDVSFKNANIQQILDACLKGQHLSYVIEKNIIAIKKDNSMAVDIFQAAPPQTVTGVVKNQHGDPMPNVSVQVKGTSRGVVTDDNGAFTIRVDNNEVLEFTSVGYETKQVEIHDQTQLSIVLNEAKNQLDTIVVTALGIKRSEKSITYASQQVGGAELTKAKDPNLINTLNGKVAGLTISSSSSGVGGSAKVILRGNKSGLGSNQALYVIDGVPMNNSVVATNGPGSNQPSTAFGGSNAYDGGDPISNLNPDDIESITILKGASAAALYGSQGANGVIIVNTKTGKPGRTQVNISSGFTMSKVAYKPKFQDNYGQSSAGSTQSWGSKISSGASDNLSDFFQTGNNWTNSISLSSGSDKMQTYFSYANTSAKGIEPLNKLGRNNITFRETGKFFNNKLVVDGGLNYVSQKIENTPLAGFYFNPLTGLYLFPRGQSIQPYKNNYEKLDPVTNLPTQNWPFVGSDDIQQNPWWIINRNPNSLKRDRVLMNASVKYEFKPWLSFQARGSIDRINDVYEQKLYSGTIPTLSPSSGAYAYRNSVITQKYGDLLANFNIPIHRFRVSGVIGTSIRDVKTTGEYFASGQDGLSLPNVFTIQNFKLINPANSGTFPANHSQWQSVFGSANISYGDWVFLDLTARNDWASNLAFTPSLSYFYPSAGLNVILSQVMKLPKAVSYAKVRGSYAEVGNSPASYQSNPASSILGAGGLASINNGDNAAAPFVALRPEKTRSIELGTEWRFFNNRLSFDFTFYKTNTRNQTLQISASQATFYNNFYVNAGNIQNKGVEIVLGYDVIRNKNFKWNTGLNYAVNDNSVIELDPRVPYFSLSGASGANYASQFAVGGSYGDFYGTVLQHDAQGRIIIGDDGKPMVQSGSLVYLGNANTKWQLGWNNNISYKDFSLSFLIDGKFGGKVMSVTQAVLDQYGVSKASGDARDAGGVKVNGVDRNGNAVTTVDAKNWYTTIGGRSGVTGEYVYSATTIRLREVALGYGVPLKNSFVKNLKFSLIGRNLLYFSKKAPFDPEMTMSTGNGLSGVDIFMPPATRNFGLSLNATF